MPQHITVLDYNPKWSQKYEEEKEKITSILQDNCIATYHIGSTSVPGLAAKPIIDIMAIVKSLKKVDEVSENLAFRDFMRTHEKEREEYAELKKVLAQRFTYDIDSYCDGKMEFMRQIEEQALSQYDSTWDRLYIAARKVQHERTISPLIEAGSVAAALITKEKNIYVGVCIDTACSLGMCAERNAIANIITNRENQIQKIAAVMPNGKMALPCGACREYMMQLDKDAGRIEILSDYEMKKVIPLKSLVPNWWYVEQL